MMHLHSLDPKLRTTASYRGHLEEYPYILKRDGRGLGGCNQDGCDQTDVPMSSIYFASAAETVFPWNFQ
jgi:hypothetical protein